MSDLVVVSQPKLQLAARETNRGKKLVIATCSTGTTSLPLLRPQRVGADRATECRHARVWPRILGCRHVEQIRKIFQTRASVKVG